MGIFDAPSRAATRDQVDIYRTKADRLTEEARLLMARGRLAEAEERIRDLITLQAKVVGDRHPDYASSLCLLASIITSQDEFADAESLLEHALDIRKKSLGENHPEYAATLDQRARLMLRWNDLSGAEPLVRKAQEIREASLGVDHSEYASSLETMGELLNARDAPQEAEPLLQQALAVRLASQGREHLETAGVMVRLAETLRRLNRFDAAETLLKQAIDVYPHGFAGFHPDHATALSALAAIHQARGQFDQAEEQLGLLLDMRRQALGANHRECAGILSQLSQLHQRRGDLTSAIDAQRQALDVMRESLGERHPTFSAALMTLGLLHQKQGDLAAAEPVLRQAVAQRKEVLGPRHPDYASSLVCLAQLVQKRGDPAWARMLLREAVEVRRSVFGDAHPEFAQGLAVLGEALAQQNELAKAESLLTQALEIRRGAFGDVHPAVASSLSSLASVLRARGDLDGAETLLGEALEIRSEALGEDHPDYATNLGNLAWILQKRGDHAGAHSLLTRALAIRRRVLGEEHPETRQNVERLRSMVVPVSESSPTLAPPSAPALTEEPSEDITAEESPTPHALEPFSAGPDMTTRPISYLADEIDERANDEAEEPSGLQAFLDDNLSAPADEPPIPTIDEEYPETDAFYWVPDVSPVSEAQPRDHNSLDAPGDWTADDDESVGFEDRSAQGLSNFEENLASPLDRPSEPTDHWQEGSIEAFSDRPTEEFADGEVPAADTQPAPDPAAFDEGIPAVEERSTLSSSRFDVSHVDGSPEFVESNLAFKTCLVEAVPNPGNPNPETPASAWSPLMSQSSSHLSQELAAMSDRFSQLGERLLSAARQLHAPGTPPAEDLLEGLGNCRRDFDSLRDRALSLAGALHLSCPAADQIQSLQSLTSVLDQAAEAEIRQSRGEETRRRAISVLDRVLALSHTSIQDFAPLRECHERARGLHSGITSASWASPHPEAERLAEGEHHFVDLITLIQDRDELSDELWATLHENVGQAFGKPLAAAAARSKLVLPTDHQGSSHYGEMAHAAEYR